MSWIFFFFLKRKPAYSANWTTGATTASASFTRSKSARHLTLTRRTGTETSGRLLPAERWRSLSGPRRSQGARTPGGALFGCRLSASLDAGEQTPAAAAAAATHVRRRFRHQTIRQGKRDAIRFGTSLSGAGARASTCAPDSISNRFLIFTCAHERRMMDAPIRARGAAWHGIDFIVFFRFYHHPELGFFVFLLFLHFLHKTFC